MAAVPIYVWNGTAWQETGPVIPASPIKYQASAPSSPSTGDIWVDSDGDVTTGSQQFQRFRFVASGGETSISGVDANGATLAYTAGTEIVALNGSTLVRGQDYTATNGTSITGLSPALVANDVVEVFSFMAFNVANTYTQSQVDGLLNDYMGMRLIVPTSVSSGCTISSTGAVSFTSASNILLNGVFSSTYDNYKIIMKFTAFSANCSLNARMSASGVDDTTSNYNYGRTFVRSTGTTGINTGNGQTIFYLNDNATAQPNDSELSFDILSPFLAERTSILWQATGNDATSWISSSAAGSHRVATSYNGINIYPSTGTCTGTVRVYGYKN